jgi:hypothetical protein
MTKMNDDNARLWKTLSLALAVFLFMVLAWHVALTKRLRATIDVQSNAIRGLITATHQLDGANAKPTEIRADQTTVTNRDAQ